MAKIVRIELGDCVVRFFFRKEDALTEARLLTQGTEEPHSEYATVHGWLVRNDITLDLRDYNGILPDETAYEISDRLWSFWHKSTPTLVLGYAMGRTQAEGLKAFRKAHPTTEIRDLVQGEERKSWDPEVVKLAVRLERV